jgi:hypothetical protein
VIQYGKQKMPQILETQIHALNSRRAASASHLVGGVQAPVAASSRVDPAPRVPVRVPVQQALETPPTSPARRHGPATPGNLGPVTAPQLPHTMVPASSKCI